MNTKNIVNILMRRDNLTENEATNFVEDVCCEMMELIEQGRYIEAEDVFSGELGLEPDYICDLLL